MSKSSKDYHIGQLVKYSLWQGLPKTDKGIVVSVTSNGWIGIQSEDKTADGTPVVYNVRPVLVRPYRPRGVSK